MRPTGSSAMVIKWDAEVTRAVGDPPEL
jgi:hypothetical protein